MGKLVRHGVPQASVRPEPGPTREERAWLFDRRDLFIAGVAGALRRRNASIPQFMVVTDFLRQLLASEAKAAAAGPENTRANIQTTVTPNTSELVAAGA